MKKTCIDTSVFMNKIKWIEENIDKIQFAIPITTLEELDNLKESRDYERSFRARRSLRFIENNKSKFEFETNCGEFQGLDSKNDNTIIKVCIDKGYSLVTNDLSMKIKAETLGVKVLKIDDKDSEYKGYRVLELDTSLDDDNEILASFYQCPEQNKLDLFVNEYLIIKDKSCPVYDDNYDEKVDYKTIDILRWDGNSLVQLKLPPKKVVNPLNDLQRCALDLLMNKDIPIKIIAGQYGSGKTMISTLVGLYLVEEKGLYNKLVLVRNNDLNDSGREIGALPGDFEDKTSLLFKTSIQHFPQGEYQAEKMKNEGKLETHITYFIKGLSINGYVLVDESEDLTIKDIKLVGSRLEKDSCIVFSGDWKQSNGKYKVNNGLIHLINNTKDNPLVGVVVLDEDVRSDASKIFADL